MGERPFPKAGAWLLFFLSYSAAGASFSAPLQDRVLEIVIEGNRTPAEEIRGSLYTKVGELFDPKVLQQDIVFLWQNKRIFVDEVLEESVPGGLRLRFRVTEYPSIRDIAIRGNREVKRDDLLDAAKLVPGIPIDEVVAHRARADLVRYYRDRGFFFADVVLRYDREAGQATFEIMEGPLVRVRSIEFEGNRSIPSSYFFGLRRSLGSVMQLGDGWFVFRGSEFQEGVLREDLIQLRRLYRGEGFKDAVVEVKDLEFNEERDRVTIRILIDEGPRYKVSGVDLQGNETFTKEELLALVQIKPGDDYAAELVERDRLALARFYGERGYPDHWSLPEPDRWSFLPPQEVYSAGTAEVQVVYRIREGRKIRIRDVKIQGNETTQDRVIRRMLTFFPGDTVNTSEISKSFGRLNSLNYFRDERGFPSLGYSFADTEDPEWKDFVVRVTEGETGSLRFGFGISSAEGFVGQIFLQKSNFDLFDPPSSWGSAFKEIFDGTAFTGAGQELLLSLAPGTKISTYNLRFREPDLFGEHLDTTSLDTNLYQRIRNFQQYTEVRTGVGAILGKNWTENWTTQLMLRNELIQFKDVAADAPALVFEQEGKNGLRSLRLDLIHGDLDVPLDPTSGYAVQLTGEAAGGALGADLDFWKTILAGRLYVPVGTDERGRAYTLFLRGVFGVAGPYGDWDDVPYSERFFTGGPDSIRGFAFRGVGPTQFGHPNGGEALGLLGAELRFPLYSTPFAEGLAETEWIRGVFFLDSGSLGTDLHDESLREWRLSAGAGVRIKLPFLPHAAIVLDYGVPIYRQDTDNTRLFSFSIGTSF